MMAARTRAAFPRIPTPARCVVLFLVTSSLVSGCARFDDAAATPFTPEPTATAVDIAPAQPPQAAPSAPPTTPGLPAGPAAPCVDPDPNVVATCLDVTGGLVVTPNGTSALVAERRTGRILSVTSGQPATETARIDVDGSGDGGLLDIALSPTYTEDGLIYAYITTPTDNRVVRIAPGDVPKTVLSGIPRGSTGNGGALDFVNPKELLVLTGDAGNPTNAADPTSLAGKLLRVVSLAPIPAPPRPQIALTGIGTAGDVCVDATSGIWVTDRQATEDRLQRITPDGQVISPAWTWPDRPGVAGCAVGKSAVAVSLTNGKAMAILSTDPHTGAVTAAPTLVAENLYGRLGGAAIGPDGQLWASTVNKTGDAPGPTDDRVVKIPLPAGGGGGFD